MRFALTLPSRSDCWAGLRQGAVLGAAVVVLTLPPPGRATLHGPALTAAATTLSRAMRQPVAPHRFVDFAGRPASLETRSVADWVVTRNDNGSGPFVILDKRDARIFVFAADGRLIDSSPVLLGAAAGDDSVAGIGKRPIAQVRPDERTTPAGRFVSRPGRNASGEDVVWVDYDAAVSMHRVRPVDPRERRLERLASNDPARRRISYGCINVPVAFFEQVIQPVIGQHHGVVYVLPESRPVPAWLADTLGLRLAGP